MKGKAEDDKVRIAVASYGCVSSAGRGADALFETLRAGIDKSNPVSTKDWPIEAQFQPKACRFEARDLEPKTSREILSSALMHAFSEAQAKLSTSERQRLKTAKIGVILASTKSFIEDFIWTCDEAALEHDAMAPLLSDFIVLSALTPARTLCVSNACASSLTAIYLASRWLKKGDVTDVWVIAADRIGPFVLQGFNSLHALTAEKVRPFAANRSGLQLGDGAAAILFSTVNRESALELQGVGIDTEGISATRPSASGESLKRACMQIDGIQTKPPELIIAHGTATPLNDPSEDQAFSGLFGNNGESPLITASKSCIGHTLGASGALDLIAACEVLRRQEIFTITNTSQIDSQFQGRYLFNGHAYALPKLSKVLVTSLGFGGVNAAAMLELNKESA